MKNKSKNNYILPTNDYAFKRIFGSVGNERITKDLLEAILDTKIDSIKLNATPILEQDLEADKIGVLDISAIIDENIQCDIEMQVLKSKDMEKRLLYYWSRLYISSFTAGKEYSEGKKTIVICILNYDPGYNIPKYHTSWHIVEDEYTDLVLTQDFEIHIISLKKLEKIEKENGTDKSKLGTWLRFIKNPNKLEESDMENIVVKDAKEISDYINSGEYEKYMAYQRERKIMDENSLREEGLQEGLQKGLKKGKKEGIKEGKIEGKIEGKKEEKIEIAKKLLNEGVDISTISKVTGLTEKEIKGLK